MSIFSRISREAKILIGITCLAGASLIWFNFFTQRFGSLSLGSPISISKPQASLPVDTTTATIGSEIRSPDLLSTAGETETPSSAIAIVTPELAATSDADSMQNEQLNPADTATIPDTAITLQPLPIAGSGQTLSNIEIAELPFLVTSPPLAEVASDLAPDSQIGTETSQTVQRASINPFSPLLLKQEAVVSPAIPANTIVNVAIPDKPQPIIETSPLSPSSTANVAVLELSPPIRTVSPPKLLSQDVLRPLPSGSLPITPSILTQALSMPAELSTEARPNDNDTVTATVAKPLSTSPAVLLPKTTSPLAIVATDNSPDSFSSDIAAPELLMAAVTAAPIIETTSIPLVVGASDLSVYLRDNNVRFTGSVIGPVSVGIFRSNTSNSPVIISLGQSFPETEFVLSSLKGQQAEVRHNNDIQTLALDLWR